MAWCKTVPDIEVLASGWQPGILPTLVPVDPLGTSCSQGRSRRGTEARLFSGDQAAAPANPMQLLVCKETGFSRGTFGTADQECTSPEVTSRQEWFVEAKQR